MKKIKTGFGKGVLIIGLFFITLTTHAQDWSEIIEGKTFDQGLVLSGKENVLIKNCTITNPKGDNGIDLVDCKNIRIENCIIRSVGDETSSDYFSGSLAPENTTDYAQLRGHFGAKGIHIFNSSNIVVIDNQIMDIFGQGIRINADDWTKTFEITIENNRIAYTYDDALKFSVEGDQSRADDGSIAIPFKGGVVRGNVIHDIGLGTTQLPFARHGMYLKARDILVEGNTIYNCFYGQAISLRNAGIIRGNKIWNCYGPCIAYWNQTDTQGSSKKVIIEDNEYRQDYDMDLKMRHIYNLDKTPNVGGRKSLLQVDFRRKSEEAVINEFVIRNNIGVAGIDLDDNYSLIGGFGDPLPGVEIKVENNRLIDLRAQKSYYNNIPLDVKTNMLLVADWQLENFERQVAKGSKWKNSHAYWAWTNATMYLGMVEAAKLSGKEKYWDFLKTIGERNNWKPGPRVYHADDICVSRLYAELYLKYGDKKMIQPTINVLNEIIDHPKNTALDATVPHNQERWSWSDALFMAPPTFAQFGKITKNERYHKFMHDEFWVTYDTLYNKKDNLFFRDTKYKSLKEPNGENIYWARGNGWVIGGLAKIIDDLPKGKQRKKYIVLYQQMMHRIAALQDKDGFWHPSLLDYEAYPMPETSASGFFVYGLAWGVNRGYLEKEEYLPIAIKGWNALVSAIHPDGKLGWVQPIGADPKAVTFDDTEVYGVGAFLLAGSEMIKLGDNQ